MKQIRMILPMLFIIVTFSCIAYNAYNHNWQLLALWIIVMLQSLSLGELLIRTKLRK